MNSNFNCHLGANYPPPELVRKALHARQNARMLALDAIRRNSLDTYAPRTMDSLKAGEV
jgi:hypothetical protein